jgi:asparagine synthase (glutamine-hydrolysing)
LKEGHGTYYIIDGECFEIFGDYFVCGIAGYILKTPVTQHPAGDILLNAIRQRGPDDEGICLVHRGLKAVHYLSTERTCQGAPGLLGRRGGVQPWHDAAFFHTRYSVIDPTFGGHQPFVSADGQCTVIFNGEIYNYIELRDALGREGIVFKTSSDTEVLAEGYRLWGAGLWPRMNGFWAAVIVDRRDCSVLFSRDRMGVAPLYVRETDEGLFFSSVIDSLRHIGRRPHVNRDVIQDFIETGVKDTDGRSVYEGIVSLPAAAVCSLSPEAATLAAARAEVYWRLPDSLVTPADLPFNAAVRSFRDLFFDAVRLRLRSDIRVGFELSGGLDSSSIVAAAAELSGTPLTTYTLKVPGRNEEPFARAMLKKHALDYRVIDGDESGLRAGVEGFARVMEEPYDTPANFLHHQMLKKIKQDGFGVILTGAGGDETLAGYEASFWPLAYREWRARASGRWPADWYEFCRRFRTVDQARATFRSYGRAVARRMCGDPAAAFGRVPAEKQLSFAGLRRYHFTTALLPYYLRSTDHYTMNIPLEHRFPLLDHRLVEFGLRLPIEYLFKDGWTKYILRKAMQGYLPPEITWRRQKFGFPFAYHAYFAQRSAEWQHYLKITAAMGFNEASAGYDVLARVNPLLLWRLISVGVWYGVDEGRS